MENKLFFSKKIVGLSVFIASANSDLCNHPTSRTTCIANANSASCNHSTSRTTIDYNYNYKPFL